MKKNTYTPKDVKISINGVQLTGFDEDEAPSPQQHIEDIRKLTQGIKRNTTRQPKKMWMPGQTVMELGFASQLDPASIYEVEIATGIVTLYINHEDNEQIHP